MIGRVKIAFVLLWYAMRKQTLPSRDIKGKVPVRLLYRIPVCLSAKAAKQKIFASDNVLLSSIMLESVAGKGWTS